MRKELSEADRRRLREISSARELLEYLKKTIIDMRHFGADMGVIADEAIDDFLAFYKLTWKQSEIIEKADEKLTELELRYREDFRKWFSEPRRL